MIDKKLKPWLIEVNHSPSFNTDSELDDDLKISLITDTIKLLGLTPARKARYKKNKQKELNDRMMGKHKNIPGAAQNKDERRKAAEIKRNVYEAKHKGNYELLFPSQNPEDTLRYK